MQIEAKLLGTGKIAQLAKQSNNNKDNTKKHGAVLLIPGLGRQKQADPETHWLANLAYLASSMPMRVLPPKKK